MPQAAAGPLCEPCRRSTTAYGACTVYDHPWEASEEYAGADELGVPAAPLAFGDSGPRVVHLHFALYTLGYLALLAPGFRADAFNAVTQDAVAAFQEEFPSPGDVVGAYSWATREALLWRIGFARSSCREITRHHGVRLRSALAA